MTYRILNNGIKRVIVIVGEGLCTKLDVCLEATVFLWSCQRFQRIVLLIGFLRLRRQ
jgi:hypothetical protein